MEIRAGRDCRLQQGRQLADHSVRPQRAERLIRQALSRLRGS